MLLEIFFDGLLGLADLNGKKDQPFVGEFLADFVNEGTLLCS